MSLAIRVENLGKLYAINRDGAPAASSLREQMARGFGRLIGQGSPAVPRPDERAAAVRDKEYWALRDISFEVNTGERVGVIGANGAGKSTLLKILSRVTAPTEGRVEIHGKVASLLEVGTGFHPELSGRENIFLNGAILGMSRQEIRKKFDQIVDFSGVEKFIDTPVKHYSSGMYVRLAFSVSAWLEPDILIVDEVLAVGDQAFQTKSAARMRELTQEGRTVLFVSHSMATMNQMCQKALYLENGRVSSFGTVEETTIEYQRDVIEQIEQGPWHRAEFTPPDARVTLARPEDSAATLLSVRVCDRENRTRDFLDIAETFAIEASYSLDQQVPDGVVPNLHFYDEMGGRVFISLPAQLMPGVGGGYKVRCVIPAFALNVGRYLVGFALSTFGAETRNHFDAQLCLRFEVVEGDLSLDKRRHGYLGTLPGFSRPRFDWTNS
ncbi:ABC transporter ATP-binding protein [Bosea sp. 2KB_26]|uniref:ABC transporter ATP-binding protein n=1 Tax=Bosea sp. 2KB_26 TaxID=3237475 RepID=UPI003F90E6A7